MTQIYESREYCDQNNLGVACSNPHVFCINDFVRILINTTVPRKLWTYVLMHYPLIFRSFYPQNGKNNVSTKLCDESQPIHFVWYGQCKFFLDAIFSHVYQFLDSRMLFSSFLSSYICTRIKIKYYINFFLDINNSSGINKLSRILMVKCGVRRMWWYLKWFRQITDTIILVRGAWDCVYIWWWSGVTFVWWYCDMCRTLNGRTYTDRSFLCRRYIIMTLTQVWYKPPWWGHLGL